MAALLWSYDNEIFVLRSLSLIMWVLSSLVQVMPPHSYKLYQPHTV